MKWVPRHGVENPKGRNPRNHQSPNGRAPRWSSVGAELARGMDVQRWFSEHWSGIAEKAVATLLGAGALYFLTFVPRIGPLLRIYVCLPVWVLLAVPVVAGLIAFLYRRARARRRRSGGHSFEEIVREIDAERNPTVFLHLGLRWDLTPQFWRVFRTTEGLAENQYVNTLILGPFCPDCHRNLYAIGSGGRSTIENPCGSCQRSLPREDKDGPSDGPSAERVKLEVFKEAQRLARRGEISPRY